MTDIPTYTTTASTHTFTWADGTQLELREPARDPARRVWAEVLAYAGPDALLNHKRLDLMDQAACDRFAAGCAALDGAVAWGPRLLYAGHHLADTLAQQEPDNIPGLALSAPPWPQPGEAAFQGLAGQIVRTIEPHTESDPMALLVQLLAMMGNAIGRAPYFAVEADKHHLNVFACLVGATSKGRKGTSAGYPKRLLTVIDPAWGTRVMAGLSSGEGVIWNVRDPAYGHDKKGEDVCLDEGIEDKRLCILETEFARALAKTGQEGNVLSAVLRQAWDHGDLRTLVSGRQKAPVAATNAHVSVIAHITVDEVRRLLTETEAANGFGNRFLWVCVRRSQLLPRGGMYPEQALKPLAETLTTTLFHARTVAQMRRTLAAEARWEDIYTELAEGQPGLLGAITARAEAQVLRLSCLYALLDKTETVDVPHLAAAYALWRYCEASARYIFGDVLGDPLADDLRRMLRQAGTTGMTRTDLYNAFGRHQKSAAIGQALVRLQRDGMVQCAQESTGGRPVERWYACAPADTRTAHKAQKAHKDVEAIHTTIDGQAPVPSAQSAQSAQSLLKDRPSDLHALHALHTQSESDDAIGGGNTGDAPASAPLHALHALCAQCAHRQTCQEGGETVCVDCGEVLSAPAPVFDELTASALYCATCHAAVSFRTLPQLDGTAVYLCDACDTEVGWKRTMASPSPNETQAPDAAPLAGPPPPVTNRGHGDCPRCGADHVSLVQRHGQPACVACSLLSDDAVARWRAPRAVSLAPSVPNADPPPSNSTHPPQAALHHPPAAREVFEL
jgi:Protein of unknown function (DUF3987)